jgi:hypothetical protein
MGAASSVRPQTSPQCSPRNEVVARKGFQQIACFGFFNGNNLSKELITPTLLETCRTSWNYLIGSTQFDPATQAVNDTGVPDAAKLGLFAADLLDRVVASPDAYKAFRPSQKKLSSPSLQVFRLVKYMLAVPDSSSNTKRSLRSLGRSHMRIGVTQEIFKLFVQAFMETLNSRLPKTSSSKDKLRAWEVLLNFFEEQFYFDKITFIAHFTKDSLRAMSPMALVKRNSDKMSGSSKSRSVSLRPIADLEHEQSVKRSCEKYVVSRAQSASSGRVVNSPPKNGPVVDMGPPLLETHRSSFDHTEQFSLEDEEVLRHAPFQLPSNERQRLKVVRDIRILDSDASDPAYDSVTADACAAFQVIFSA